MRVGAFSYAKLIVYVFYPFVSRFFGINRLWQCLSKDFWTDLLPSEQGF
jgi:hypothetical protein